MKYYVYISETKVDMLYSQITNMESERSLKSGLKVGILSVEAETKNIKSVYDKINEVINEIDDIGDIYSDAEYIRGTLAMGWNARNKLNYKSNATYWIGEAVDGDGILNKILLIGSQHHIIGNKISEDYCYSTSYIDSFFNAIENRIDFETLKYNDRDGQSEIRSTDDKKMIQKMKERNASISEMKLFVNDAYLADFIDEFSGWHNGIFQEYEFVAKLLHSEMKVDNSGNMIRYAIATPIYVVLLSQIDKRIIIEKGRKKYILTRAEYEQHKIHDFRTIHLLLKRSGLDENRFTKEMKVQYEKYNGGTKEFNRSEFNNKAIEIVKEYFCIV
ncbi:MAG: hypothetical protein IJO85_07560 [Lachnospiraceae bacterium]|nr:hypothetical protein [Lachnospiraceae bacterium]